MTASLAAGDMQWRVTLQSRVSARAENGEETTSWADLITVWAKVVDQSGRKFFRDDQTQLTLDIEVRIRRREGITPELRLLHKRDESIGYEPYDIVQVIDAGAPDRHLQILAVKGVRDGR